MRIHAKETVALVGESGCGKSTIVSLLLRFYDVNEGSILIDGVDIKAYNLAELRKNMGLVMQEPTLFNYSITENILYGALHSSNSQLLEAAEVANAMEFIQSQSIAEVIDESAASLLQEFESNRQMLT